MRHESQPLTASTRRAAEGAERRLAIEYRILGPVEAWRDDRPLVLGGPKMRTVLAILLVHANHVVAADRLVDDLWGDDPPAGCRNVVQAYVSRLRALLGCPRNDGFLLTRPSGYMLEAARHQLDLHRFQDLVDAAEQAIAEGLVAVAADRLRESLALWRGPALGGVASEALQRTVGAGLEEQRLRALERRIEIDLQLGRHRDLIAELTELVAGCPFRERLYGQLMIALYRSGRQSEALRLYRTARDELAGELGVQPEPELQGLERCIRSGDPALLAGFTSVHDDASRRSQCAPSQLPPGIPDFTGRAEPLADARRLLGPGDGNGCTATRAVVVTGPPGVGKTTFATRAAQEVRDHYPDGQLFWDLRGTEVDPAEPNDVVAGFLRALGVHSSAIPADPDERAALYRDRLAERQVLVVLDNVSSEAQVRPLLPSGPGCAVLVTSRVVLGGLEGAATLPLAVLQADEAVELLAKVATQARVAEEPAAARTIVELCGGLPLAVRIAGAKLATRTHLRLGRLAERLGDERGRLDELRVGDLEVRASLALSYRGQDEEARRAFRLLSVLDSPDFPIWQAAGLLDLGVVAAEVVVERMVDAHLVEVAGEDGAGQMRYRFHSLVRAFARERLHETETAAARQAALERALGAQLTLVELARAALSPGDACDAPRGASTRRLPDVPAIVESLLRAPLDWLEAERASLVASVKQASASGLIELAWELACSLPTFLAVRGYWQDWRSAKLLALEANRRAACRHGEAHLLFSLGQSHFGIGEWSGARSYHEECLARYRELADEHGERHSLLALALVGTFQGQLEGGAERFECCATLFRKAGDWYGEALALHGLADVHRMQGRLTDAAASLDVCLAVFREAGERYWEASVLRVLGEVRQGQGRLEEARACFELCLGTLRDFRDRYLEARVLYSLGKLNRAQGRLSDATGSFHRCVVICSELNLPKWEARARSRLEETWVAQALCEPAAVF